MSTTRMMAGAILTVGLIVPTLLAQTHRRAIYSKPEFPSEEALQRLNLRQAWRGAVPMDGMRDGFIRIEYNGNDLLILTRSGLVTRLNAETGRVHWRTRVGRPYTLLPYVVSNVRSVYVIATATMFALDRETGAQKWDRPLPGALSAGPAVDEEQIYVPSSTGRLYTFYLPFVTLGIADIASPGEVRRESLVYSRGEAEDRIQPKPVWDSQTYVQLSFRPLTSSEEVMVVGPDGKGACFNKVPGEEGRPVELFSFDLDHKVTVAPAEYGDTAYIGCDDATMYALSMKTGKLIWRHTAGTPISRSPVIIDNDVYFTSDREGLARLDRASGDTVWKVPHGRRVLDSNPNADRFLAANTRFVYATDHSGRLLVLDRKRGTKLSMLDTTAWRFPIINDTTDRLYLAANDGVILCLHDRDQREPIRQRKSLEDLASPVLKRLAQNINDPGSKEVTLREALLDLRKRYGVHYVIAERAFKEAKLPDPQDAKVTPPRTENKPLKDHLQRILNQANASYQVVEKTVLIIPGKKKDK